MNLERWTAENAADLYGIRNWGAGYFDVSPSGDVVVTPFWNNKNVAVPIPEIISGISARGLDLPVLLRIENILDSQLHLINESFAQAMETLGYKGAFRGVYPIKVNQQQHVIESVTRFGARYHHGLEAGSKAELLAAMATLRDPEACLVCNGYKDREFIDLGLYARKLGIRCIFVLEMAGELDLIIERSKALDVEPIVGLRIKLSASGGGHWIESGGDRSIFGLTPSQALTVVDRLRDENMLGCLQLLHYHLGSQIPNIRDIRSGLLEACHFYAGLVEEGAAMGYLDVGGGLAVDYDGSNTNFASSRNYSTQEYCVDVIETIMTALDEKEVPHPTVIAECGRAVVAYYSVLLFDALEVNRVERAPLPEVDMEALPQQVANLFEVRQSLSLKNLQECYNDAVYYRDEVRQLFKAGLVTIRERALADQVFWDIIHGINELSCKLKRVPTDLMDLDLALSDIYYCNFSVFQSLPDSWAIGLLFPIMPVHRLAEQPTRQAVLADITCDSDGKLDRFIDPHGVARTLAVHELRDGEDYVMGAFLVGAYQETLGDLHNLFGDTNVVTVRVNADGSYDFVRELEGDSVADTLAYVEFSPRALRTSFRESAEKAVRAGAITPHQRREIMRAFEEGLSGYTYFETGD